MSATHPWNERLDLGAGALDHDHHTQIALLTAFTDALEQGRPALARRLVEELGQYSRAHFSSEELLMETHHYPAASAHAAEHEILLDRIGELDAAQGEGNVDLALSLALDFRSALAAHVNDADRRVAEQSHAVEGRTP